MKLNKLISKGLTLGIILNSISVISYANTEIPNRYQTLEGEYITIDDSTEGNLEEIEIFGNTVQDKNNLEDIQSVGDLYVDENGNPILDSQGREQYKVSIISKNKNLDTAFIDKYNPDSGWIDSGGGWTNVEYNEDENAFYTKNHRGFLYKNLKPNKKYTFSAELKRTGKTFNGEIYSVNFQHPIRGLGYPKSLDWERKKVTVTSNEKGEIYFVLYNGAYIKNAQLEEGEIATQYESNEEKVLDLLLPCKLEKIGDATDRLYWDNNQGRYIIQKNIGKKVLDGSEKWSHHSVYSSIDYACFEVFNIINSYRYNNQWETNTAISSRFKQSHWFSFWYDHTNEESFGLGDTKNRLLVKIDKNIATNVESFKLYLSRNPLTILYQMDNNNIIKTNITSKLKIPTYDEKTHIYVETENSINPTLKVIVDRLSQIAKEAIAQAESDNSNHNIALARMYINMLPESSYKDELQTQLSDIFSSDMVLDSKTSTSNLDVYIKCENILQMSLDTNQISFDDFSGIEDVEKLNAVNITINSSLPYQINAYLPSEIQNSDKTKTLDKSILNIKESSSNDYQTFSNINEKVVLKDNCSAGNQLTHGVDLKLAGGIAHEKDVYKAIIKLEAEQK